MSYIDANFEVLYALACMVLLALFVGSSCYMMGRDSGYKKGQEDTERRAWERENNPLMRLVKLYGALMGSSRLHPGPFSQN